MLTSCIARVSRDGRDLVIISEEHRIVFIRDFERICRGETTFEQARLVLGIQPEPRCYGLGFEDDRVCGNRSYFTSSPSEFPYLCRF